MREGLRGAGEKSQGFDLVDSELAGEAAVCTESLSYYHQQQAALGTDGDLGLVSGRKVEKKEDPLLRAESELK